jgi:NADPH-dependent 2,4-dienoyl-CoA reductase/sulfur reductase-like enzyme
MSAASQAKRRRPDAEVVAFERGPHVSYAACGMPYNIANPARDLEDLVAVSAEQFRAKRGIDLRTDTEATALDTSSKKVTVRERQSGHAYELSYDKLVIATGAQAVRPPLNGLDLPGVFVLRELSDGYAIKRYLAETRPLRAVIIGAGYIGMEMAESLVSLGLSVTVIEREAQVLPGYEPAIASLAADELARQKVSVHTSSKVEAIESGPEPGSLCVRTSEATYDAQLVLVSVGVRPNTALARNAGIVLGETGAIAVDTMQRTSAPDVFAAGDCAEALHLVSGRPAYVPLGTTANKQGKVAGANATFADEHFGGIVGTAGFKLFDLEVGRTGLSSAEAARFGRNVLVARSTQGSRGLSYPGSRPITTLLVVERGTRRLCGAQMIGTDTVAKRIDILATALHAKMTVDEVEGLDLSYAPPFAPVYDPVLIAATVAIKALEQDPGTQ